MLRTKETKYIVSDVERTHIWLEVLRGSHQGIRVSVPLTECLQELSEGDVVSAVLESDTEEGPNWRVADFEHTRLPENHE